MDFLASRCLPEPPNLSALLLLLLLLLLRLAQFPLSSLVSRLSQQRFACNCRSGSPRADKSSPQIAHAQPAAAATSSACSPPPPVAPLSGSPAAPPVPLAPPLDSLSIQELTWKVRAI